MSTIPAQAIDAEKAILAAGIMEPESLLQITDIIETNDFYKESHKLIFHALLDLFQLGEPIDIVSLQEKLKTQGNLDNAGGENYITDIAISHITAANVKYHAKIVHKKSLLRKTGAWAHTVEEQSRNGIEDVNEWLGKIETDFINITQTSRSKNSPRADKIIQSIHQFWEDSLSGKAVCVPPPDFLEDHIPGCYPKHWWMIGGYTGKGKSIFLNQILCDIMGEGGKTLIFSLEDSREEKLMRMIANLADINYKKLMTGRVSDVKGQIRAAEKALEKWNPIIYDDVRNMDDIRLKTKKHKIQDGINIVAIDYYQNLAIKNNLYETMVDAAVTTDAMVKELGITCIGVSQIDNESAKKDSGIIGLKGAGELAAAAGIVLWLTRGKGKGKERHMDCTIKKNRPFGETGTIELEFSNLWTQVHKRRYDL